MTPAEFNAKGEEWLAAQNTILTCNATAGTALLVREYALALELFAAGIAASDRFFALYSELEPYLPANRPGAHQHRDTMRNLVAGMRAAMKDCRRLAQRVPQAEGRA